MSKPVTVDDFGKALSEFVGRSALRLSTSPLSEVDPDEMRAFERVTSTLAALLNDAKNAEARRS